MCLITIITWVILTIVVFLISQATDDSNVIAAAGLGAVIAGVILPVILNLFRPLFFGWHRARKALHDKLMSQGVLTRDDLQKNPRFIHMREVAPGTERTIAGTAQAAFLLSHNGILSILGEKTCLNSKYFKVIPGNTGKCSRCWVIWACGGEGLRLRVTMDDEQERDFRIECREGRNLRQVARSTEMLEELLELDTDQA